MKLKKVILAVLLLLSTAVSAQCEKAAAGLFIDHSVKLCSQNYVFEIGMTIGADNIVVDCSGAVIQGTITNGRFNSSGLAIDGKNNVTLIGCHLVNWEKGIEIRDSESIVVRKNYLIRNNIGIWLQNTKNSIIEESNDISLQKAVRLVNSTNNWLQFENKKLDGEECLVNVCNTHFVQQQTINLQPTLFDELVYLVINGWL